MALLKQYLKRVQDIVQKIKCTIKQTFSEFSDEIANVIVIVIICVVLIITGTVISLFYSFLLGEKDLFGWAVTHSLPVLILTAVCVAGSFISYGVAKLHAKLLDKILVILFWFFTFFGPIIWTHIAKLFDAPEMIQYRKMAIFVPSVFLIVSIFVYGFLYNINMALKDNKQKKMQQSI